MSDKTLQIRIDGAALDSQGQKVVRFATRISFLINQFLIYTPCQYFALLAKPLKLQLKIMLNIVCGLFCHALYKTMT